MMVLEIVINAIATQIAKTACEYAPYLTGPAVYGTISIYHMFGSVFWTPEARTVTKERGRGEISGLLDRSLALRYIDASR